MIDEIYIVHKIGVPLLSWSRRIEQQETLLAGFLTALTLFSQQIGGNAPTYLDFGARKYVFKNSPNNVVSFVCTVTEYDDVEYARTLLEIISRAFLHEFPESSLEEFTGNVTPYKSFLERIESLLSSDLEEITRVMDSLTEKQIESVIYTVEHGLLYATKGWKVNVTSLIEYLRGIVALLDSENLLNSLIVADKGKIEVYHPFRGVFYIQHYPYANPQVVGTQTKRKSSVVTKKTKQILERLQVIQAILPVATREERHWIKKSVEHLFAIKPKLRGFFPEYRLVYAPILRYKLKTIRPSAALVSDKYLGIIHVFNLPRKVEIDELENFMESLRSILPQLDRRTVFIVMLSHYGYSVSRRVIERLTIPFGPINLNPILFEIEGTELKQIEY